jgi:hypothetical protein
VAAVVKKDPPTFIIPEPENTIEEATPAEVILLEAVMVPVESNKLEVLAVPVVPDKVIVVQVTTPAPTLELKPVTAVFAGLAIVIPPVRVMVTPELRATVAFIAAVVLEKEAALTLLVIVAVPPVLVTEIAPVVVNPAKF